MPNAKSRRRRKFVELVNCKSWPEASARLKEGASAYAVAEFMQRQGDYAGVKAESLARQLHRYREEVLEVKKTLSQSFIDKKIESLDLAISDIDEMTKLILVQKERIGKDLKLEDKLPKLMALRPEIAFLFDMLERRARLLQDLGHLPKVPVKVNVLSMGDETLSKLLDTYPADKRAELRRMIQQQYLGQGGANASAEGPGERGGSDRPGSARQNGLAHETEES